MTHAQRNAQQRRSERRLRAERHRDGLCIECAEPHRAEHQRCLPCRIAQRRQKNRTTTQRARLTRAILAAQLGRAEGGGERCRSELVSASGIRPIGGMSVPASWHGPAIAVSVSESAGCISRSRDRAGVKNGITDGRDGRRGWSC